MVIKRSLFFKRFSIVAIVASSVMTSLSYASSDEAWRKHDQDVKSACIKASQFKNAKPVSDVMLFDDSVGYSAILIQGQYRQAYMNNKVGQELCLWNKKSKKAYLTEANVKVH